MGHKYSMKFDKAKHKALHLARNSPSKWDRLGTVGPGSSSAGKGLVC